jgi:hypothetical protein
VTIMQNWLRTGQPQPVPGVVDSLSNTPEPRRTGQVATGHPVTSEPPGGDRFDPGRVDVHDWNQQIAPTRFASLATVSGEQGALASSIACHQGRAVLGLTDESGAANATLTTQLGRNAPDPLTPQRQPSPAPTGLGQQFGTTPERPGGMAYLPGAMGGQRQPGWTFATSMAARTAPGE